MKKVFLCGLIAILTIGLCAKVTLFLKLDRIAKEPRVRPEIKCEDGVSYSDELIAITWNPLISGFYFDLTNKTKTTLSIPWEECSFVNEDGVTFRVVHGAAGKVLNIDPDAKISDIVAPVDYMVCGKKGWALNPIFQEKWSDEDFARIENKDLIFKVMLPIKRERIKTVYVFYFKAFAK